MGNIFPCISLNVLKIEKKKSHISILDIDSTYILRCYKPFLLQAIF